MANDDLLTVEGVFVETLPDGHHRVQVGHGHQVIAHLAGKARKNHISLRPGDRVQVELSPLDMGKGRIVHHERTLTWFEKRVEGQRSGSDD